ncbi:MAG: DNA primase [Pseudohongiellaceae bacterium]|jgi:DNA primase
MAGLIPQAFIDNLLNRADIIDVIDKRVPLKKSGKNYSACCPFHQEKTPSFSVQPDRQFYYCFGCGAAGNAIGFIMNFEQVDFPQAVENLARENGLEVPREESPAAAQKQSENAKLYDVLEQASNYYQQQLRRHKDREQPIGYLKARGLSGAIAKDFNIGYAPSGWDNLITELGVDEATVALLAKSGMLIEKERGADSAKTKEGREHYDRFRHRIMFPIRDARGRTIAFGGRVLGDDKPKYLNSPETPVFHKGSELYGLYEAKKAGNKHTQLLVVEGYMDVIALAQAGICNAVATLGTATGAYHLQRLFRMVSEVVFCFDGDKAGRTAAWRALEASLPEMQDGRQVKFLFLPEGEDPDTLVRQIGADKFNQVIADATPLEAFFFDKLAVDIDVSSIEGKAKLSKLAQPLLKLLPHGVYGQLMKDKLAQLMGIGSEALEKLMEQPVEPYTQDSLPPAPMDIPPYVPGPASSAQRPGNRGGGYGKPDSGLARYRRPLSLKAIQLLLRNPEIALSLTCELEPLRSAEDESLKLLLTLIEIVKSDPTTKTFTLLGYCYGTSLGNQLTQFLKEEKITPAEGVEMEFQQIVDNILSDIIRKLEFLQLKDRMLSAATNSGKKKEDKPDGSS